ncbi:MAG: hypothetical protein JWO71_1331 [Candidatus Acidoferrum typicum]|nr:hypothetical protein [Candidatus Acidoferrum typicum]
MKALRFWLQLNGIEQEIIIPAEYVESTIVPAAEHEAGHIIAAHHYKARVLGIAVGFIPEHHQRGMFLQAVYAWKKRNWSIETQCEVKAAGPAADILYSRECSEQAAKGDLDDIEALTGVRSLEPYLSQAKGFLAEYADQFKSITARLRENLETVEERTLGMLPTKYIGAFLVDEAQLMGCLAHRESNVPSS